MMLVLLPRQQERKKSCSLLLLLGMRVGCVALQTKKCLCFIHHAKHNVVPPHCAR